MTRTELFASCLLTLFGLAPAAGQTRPWTSDRPDGHAPIGVMADHTHSAGEVMLSYRAMHMSMEGSRVGTDSVSDSEVVSPTGENFLVTPVRMPMTMHMLGVMYAPTDELTLMAMLPVTLIEMDHLTRAGSTFSTEARGVGDVSVTAMYVLGRFERQRIHASLGVRLPSGSIEKSDVTPASAPGEARLPYPMQLGSGTVDLAPGLTYLVQSDDWSGGAQVQATLRTGQNDAGYRLGHRFMATGWVARRLGNRWSVSARLASETWGNIDGEDPSFAGALATRMVPTVFPDLRGGKRLDLGAGVNVYLKPSRPGQVRLAFEFMAPVYQDLDGPQLERDYQLIGGIQLLY